MLKALALLSRQAQIALLGYILVAISLFFPTKVPEGEPENQPYDLKSRMLVFILMLIPMAISTYTINCLVVGQCNVWSWVNGALVFGWALLIFGLSAYYSFYRPPKQPVVATVVVDDKVEKFFPVGAPLANNVAAPQQQSDLLTSAAPATDKVTDTSNEVVGVPA